MDWWSEKDFDHRCLACGGEMANVLWRLGSIHCHDCRAAGRRVDGALLQQWADAQREAARRVARSRRGAALG